MLQDLLSELADAGVLGVEISKIPRMRRNTHSYRLHEGEGEEEMGHSTDRYSSNLHFSAFTLYYLYPQSGVCNRPAELW